MISPRGIKDNALKGAVWDFQKNWKKYYAADVSVLRQGFEKFRQEVKNLMFREDPDDSANPFPGVGVGVKNCTTTGLANSIF